MDASGAESKVVYRQLFVRGTRIRARVLYTWSPDPRSVEEIAVDYDLPTDAVQEALVLSSEKADDPVEMMMDVFGQARPEKIQASSFRS